MLDASLLSLQIRVSRILADGFVFSIVGIAGVGSLVSLIKGLQAMAIIQRSNGKITGVYMAWWCIIVGVIGTATLPFFLFLNIAQPVKVSSTF